ncbi:hypothetical protein CR513_40621, partial [Mucuna pruriens]
MFTTEHESAKRGQGREKTKVDSVRKTSAKACLIVHARTTRNSASEDQKQAKPKFVLDNQVRNPIPIESDFSTRKNAKSDSNQTRTGSNPTNMDVVENGNYIPTKEDGSEIPRSSWNKD